MFFFLAKFCLYKTILTNLYLKTLKLISLKNQKSFKRIYLLKYKTLKFYELNVAKLKLNLL